MRNVLSIVPRASQEVVASMIRTIFAQPDAKHVQAQFDEVIRVLTPTHSKVAQMLLDAREDLLAFCGFPPKHWRQIWSTNPIERVNKEIKRRTDVVGVFPNPAALLRLPARSSSNSTTSGRRGPAATSPRPPCASWTPSTRLSPTPTRAR
jgi:putative transposase